MLLTISSRVHSGSFLVQRTLNIARRRASLDEPIAGSMNTNNLINTWFRNITRCWAFTRICAVFQPQFVGPPCFRNYRQSEDIQALLLSQNSVSESPFLFPTRPLQAKAERSLVLKARGLDQPCLPSVFRRGSEILACLQK